MEQTDIRGLVEQADRSLVEQADLRGCVEQADISGWVEWANIRGFSANNLALSFINICVHIKNPRRWQPYHCVVTWKYCSHL